MHRPPLRPLSLGHVALGRVPIRCRRLVDLLPTVKYTYYKNEIIGRNGMKRNVVNESNATLLNTMEMKEDKFRWNLKRSENTHNTAKIHGNDEGRIRTTNDE